MRCFTPLKLLCSKYKQKLIHGLVKINTCHIASPYSHTQADCCSEPPPAGPATAPNTGSGIFPERKPETVQFQKLLGTLYFSHLWATPISPSRITFPIKTVLESPGRIKPISSVASETSEETSTIILRKVWMQFSLYLSPQWQRPS